MQHKFWSATRLAIEVVGPGGSERQVLNQPCALIGSDPRCDVVLMDDRLPARCYAALLTDNGLLGVSLVCRSVARFRRLNGDRGIRIGRFRVYVRTVEPATRDLVDPIAPRPASTCDKDTVAYLRWQSAGRKQYAQLKHGRPLLFGRRAPSRMWLESRAVSAAHGIAYRHADRLWLIDLASTNGTFVDDRAVQCAGIAPNGSFEVGGITIRYTQSPVHSAEVSAAAASDSTAGTPAAQLTATLVAERDALQANVDRLQEAVDDLRRQLAESQLQLGRWETQSSTCTQAQQQLEEEIADWKRCRHEQHAEFDGRQRELEYAEHQHAAWVAQWRNEWAVRTADLDVRRDALRRYEAQLAAEWAAIERARDDLTQRTTEWAERLAQLTAGCQAADRRRVEQESRLQREAEQLLVRRIRLQRQFRRHEEELKQRQQELMLWHDELMQRQEDLARQQVELTERHLQLDQREIALPGPTPAPGAPSVPNGRARTIPLPPGVSELAVQPSSVAADSAAETCHDEPFELANPLLESADFTELLSEFLLVEQDESDEA